MIIPAMISTHAAVKRMIASHWGDLMDETVCDDRARSEYDACDNQDIHLLLPPFQQAHLKRLYFCHYPGRIQHAHNHGDERNTEHHPLQKLGPIGPARSMAAYAMSAAIPRI